MEDREIVALYFARDQRAIPASAEKYGAYCHTVAYRILRDQQDAEECVNDTYLRAWEAIPPHRPSRLSVFLGKITRNLSLNRLERYSARKRGGGEVPLALAELAECVPARDSVEEAVDGRLLTQTLEAFLTVRPPLERQAFLRRYWYLQTTGEIAREMAISQGKVKTLLSAGRKALRSHLEKEGIVL